MIFKSPFREESPTIWDSVRRIVVARCQVVTDLLFTSLIHRAHLLRVLVYYGLSQRAMDHPDKLPPESGRRRAALRVKQQIRHDLARWSPNGMKRRKGRKSTSSPATVTKSVCTPWNERFIFDDESLPSKERNAPEKIWRRSVHGKEKDNNIVSKRVDEKQSRIRQYTERSDGELVIEFGRCEVISSLPMRPSLITSQSASTSPFDLAKVRAALGAYPIDHYEEEESKNDNDNEMSKEEDHRTALHESMGTAASVPEFIPPSRVLPMDKSELKSTVAKFEELLYTSLIEEELFRCDLIKKRPGEGCYVPNLTCEENEDEIRIPILSSQRQDKINEYAAERHKCANILPCQILTKNGNLSFDEIVESFVESILEKVIEDIAGEVEEAIVEEMENVISSL